MQFAFALAGNYRLGLKFGAAFTDSRSMLACPPWTRFNIDVVEVFFVSSFWFELLS